MTRIRHGKEPILPYTHIIPIKYNGFSGVPTVVCTIEDTWKLGAQVSVRDVTPTGFTAYCFYNGGEELYEGIINWIAIGPTTEVRTCTHVHPGGTHICGPDIYA